MGILKDLIETIDFINNSDINAISYNYLDKKDSKIKSKNLLQKKIIIFNIAGFQYSFYIGEKDIVDFVDYFFK